MEIIFFTMSIFLGVILVMSVGVLFKRRPIQGSCGGIANFMGGCDICAKKDECMEKFKAATDSH